MKIVRWSSASFCFALLVGLFTGISFFAQALDTSPPSSPVKLIFIHHSTGTAWLSDTHGHLGLTLRDNNYYVSDTNYGWGPSVIGDRTDIGNWYDWFSGPNRETYCAALYTEYGQHSTYSRLASAPTGENKIVLFKSCFPNSHLGGSPSDPIPAIGSNPLRSQSAGSGYHTISNAKGIYIELLNYFAAHPDKMFVVVTAPPLMAGATNAACAANARLFNDWLVNEWLAAYPYHNVFVFDFYNVLTSDGGTTRINAPNTNDLGWADGNHHRISGDAVQHMETVAHNYLAYWTGDSHPSAAGDLKASGEFAAWLNATYHCWQGTGGCPSCAVDCSSAVPVTGVEGSPVSFQGLGSSSGCTASPAYDWNFGDGSAHAATASASHTYASPGVYPWSLTVTSGAGNCVRSGSIRINAVTPLRVPGSAVPTTLASTSGGLNGTVTWDAAHCPSAGYHLIYGFGNSLAVWGVSGGACDIGTTGSYGWSGIPTPTTAQRFLWFLVVGDGGPSSTTEGSWGATSAGSERGGASASGQCGKTAKSTAGACLTP